ncbi:hypothetical protein D3C77_362170 [compost metagenome]
MVHVQQQHILLLIHLQHLRPEQRGTGQIKRLDKVSHNPDFIRLRLHPFGLKLEAYLRVNALNDPFSFALQCSSQCLMAMDQQPEALFQALRIQSSFDAKCHRHVPLCILLAHFMAIGLIWSCRIHLLLRGRHNVLIVIRMLSFHIQLIPCILTQHSYCRMFKDSLQINRSLKFLLDAGDKHHSL